MNCCQCQGIESLFDRQTAAKELKAYRRQGPPKETRILLEALQAAGVEGHSLLDIGGGIGAIQHELAAVAEAITNVDASTAYLNAAREEARQRGYADRASYHHGNFVDLAPNLEPADVVTLDRVVCCYHDAESLVSLSAALAGRLYGLIYPRDTWWMKLFGRVFNAMFRLRRHPFRLFIHPTAAVDTLIRRQGLEPQFYRRSGVWQVAVYQRRPALAA
ncbi:MAG: class I SAM-dependent methyltransferase [Chloroflexi bacterium]|nr:class I SAM-dependent methyltransferase [Chloroflexota bacterium]